MGYNLKILLQAEFDVATAIEYYAKINEALPLKFANNVDEAYSYLRLNLYFGIKYRLIRALPIKDFPYLLLFTIDENKKVVEILSCFHTSQHPKKYPN